MTDEKIVVGFFNGVGGYYNNPVVSCWEGRGGVGGAVSGTNGGSTRSLSERVTRFKTPVH
jgi:hypothetical protein